MMLSFEASIVIIALNFILTKAGPLDWARVEIPWARADRSKFDAMDFRELIEALIDSPRNIQRS